MILRPICSCLGSPNSFAIQAVYLALAMLPDISGNLHVMANPNFSYSKKKIVDTGKSIPTFL
jgi:hypothetical protein